MLTVTDGMLPKKISQNKIITDKDFEGKKGKQMLTR